MSEAKPQQPSEQTENPDLSFVSEIANEQKAALKSDSTDLEKREEAAYQGKTIESAFISKAGEEEEEKLTLKYENAALRLRNDRLEHKNKIEILLDEERTGYTKALFILTVVWLSVVVLFVFLTALKYGRFNQPDCKENCLAFQLSENVLIAFITSTTATVIGIFIIVAKWLFPSPQKEEKEEKKEK